MTFSWTLLFSMKKINLMNQSINIVTHLSTQCGVTQDTSDQADASAYC